MERRKQQKMTLQRLSMLIDALDVNCGDSFHAAMWCGLTPPGQPAGHQTSSAGPTRFLIFLILEDQEHPGWKCDWAEASMKLSEMLTHTVIAPGSQPQHVTAV
ncbi:hypothetical protein CRENBAI_004787 [Crenichthys baileyi]|uniref:Uncharacterized protein n=1 Tax=Crenichthys baileyi TaxID=28760 RepID=A0AAV9R0J8_9TELE